MKKIYLLLLLLVSIHLSAQLKAVAYNDGDQKLNGFSIVPTKLGKETKGILILPAWKGIDEHAKESAKKLAELGYYAFIADIYGEGNYPKDAAEAGKQAGFYKQNFKSYQKRISLALEQLIKSGADANKIVVIGYCFGGTGALEAARSGMPVKGIVSFHGGLKKDTARTNEPISTKVLVLHGADDPNVPPAEVAAFQQEMNESKADWQMVYYANAVHAFTDPYAGNDNSKGAAYNEKADKRSWEHMLTFLKEVLK
ncbi:MAG: dienelactone hydrolase [Flavobacterium sp. BFFFF1]|uniref:dienelactone hydrolase family protein n=1 Tax=unclassified Flavobacterium TaxID=196869 RepID=UPI000BCCB7B3|nr:MULTISPECIES: dienelactone hydrolase family protein [unclassified Flavobacterium]OYU81222.1 MAG: dienelactone hydrolase [Flavobacterium sp. BFFFF1]